MELASRHILLNTLLTLLTLFTPFTLFTLFKLLYTAETVAFMPIHIVWFKNADADGLLSKMLGDGLECVVGWIVDTP